MAEYAGRKGNLKLLVDRGNAVVVDTSLNLVIGVGDADAAFAAYDWEKPSGSIDSSVLELASSALTTLDINVITASGRMYTIPDGVKSEAQKALNWRKEEKRGGTPVGLNTARTLAKGGQIGIEKVRHIAKYFPRHEVDKKGKGWEPGEDNFPSNGRIAWALWGGDAARRWASAIVERENKKAVTAGGYALPSYLENSDAYRTRDSYTPDVNAFKDAFELDEHSGPEFLARVRLDGSGLDRLYKVEPDGSVYVWDNMGWDNLGHVNGDIWTYDKELDDEDDDCLKDHVLIDPSSAMIISALMQEDPYRKVSIEDIDPEEAYLVSGGLPGEDWAMADYAMTAAAEQKPTGAINPNDNIDTPAEKAERSKSQSRDATGKYAAAGSRVVVGNDTKNGRGLITGLDKATGAATVQLDNGNTVTVPSKLTAPEEGFSDTVPAANPTAPGKPLDVEGILGEPKSPVDRPNVQLPGTLPPMSAADLKSVVNDWSGYVASQRAGFKPLDGQAPDSGSKIATVKDGKIVTQKMSPTAADKANAGKPVINPAAQGAKTEAKRDNNAAGRAPAPAPKPGAQGPSPRAADRANQGKPVINTGAQTAKVEARRDGAAAGRAPVPAPPTPKPVVPGAEARKDKAAAGRAPVVTAEQRRDKAAAGRAPAPKPEGKNIIQQAGENFAKTWDKVNREGIFAPPPIVKKAVGDIAKKFTGTAPGEKKSSGGTSPDAAERRQQDKDKVVSANREKLRQDRNADRKAAAPKADPGKYVVEKGDSLWSIAEKNKPAGKSTAEYWNEVMKANPKGNFKSGNPSLIYSGEKVNLPGKAPAAPVDPKAQTARTEARRDKATAGRGPAPKAKPAVPAAEARKDKAAAGRGPAPKPGVPSSEAKKDKAAAGRAPAPKPGTQGPSPRAADKANEGKPRINTGAQTAKAEARRDKAAAGRPSAPKPSGAQKPSPRAADKANEGKPVINTGAQTAKTEAKRDKTSSGRAPAPKPAAPTTTPRAADRANEGKPVINTGAQTAKTEAKRDRNRGSAGTRKRK
jgi:LysM repeat protein